MEPDILEKLEDFTFFAPQFFKIRSKSGAIKPLSLNRAQAYIHERLELQLKETGRVRALILKGRQQGCSTLIAARFCHKIITNKGRKAFILTHEHEATTNLFDITKRYIENLPVGICPKPDYSAANKLYFKTFDSGYAIGTAGNKAVGRSQTIQLFHGSETAYWPHAADHAKGVLQAISNEEGTEIILESTANGIGNYFHQMWRSAVAGESGYQAIFVPWYWQEEYQDHKAGFVCDEEELKLLHYYGENGLTSAHLAWRRLKIREFSHDFETGLEQFKQEYPLSAHEAFINPIERTFINGKHVLAARHQDLDIDGQLIIGVDVAISNRDRTAIIRRRGRVAYNLERLGNFNTMEICGYVKRLITNENPAKVYIDCIGIGAGVVDRLQEMGYDCVEGVNVARSANDKERFRNLRAELWSDMRDWMTQEMPVQLPDEDELHGELCSLGFKFSSSGQLQIESKDDLRSRGMPSPDGADALSLTFYGGFYINQHPMPVVVRAEHEKGMFS